MNRSQLLGAAIVGAVLGAGVSAAILHKSGFTNERRATRLFLAGCKVGFARGYAARELWSAEDIAISQSRSTAPTGAAEDPAQNARQRPGIEIESFRRQTANAAASAVADTLAVREICDHSMQTTPLSSAHIDRILRSTVAH